MLAVGVADKAEDDGSNFGAFILTLEGGKYGLEQLTEPFGRGGGTFEVHGSSFVYTADNGDGPFACAFVLTADTLSFPTVHDADGKRRTGELHDAVPGEALEPDRWPGRLNAERRAVAEPRRAADGSGRRGCVYDAVSARAAADAGSTRRERRGHADLMDRPRLRGRPNSDLTIIRLDKVIDPKHPNRLIDPPADLAAWVAKLPGLTTVAPARRVLVGGLDATQVDLRTGSTGILIAPIPGIDYSLGYSGMPALGQLESGKVFRLVFVPVAGDQVVIGMWADGDDGDAHFQSTVDALQPVVDSIVWQ